MKRHFTKAPRQRRIRRNDKVKARRGILEEIFAVFLPAVVGILALLVGIQANRISALANNMQLNSMELAERANQVGEVSLQLSKRSLEQMRVANSIAEKSATIAQTSIDKMEEANRISASNTEISSKQLDLTKDLALPQFNFTTTDNGIVTRYDIACKNTVLINVEASVIRNRLVFAFEKGKSFSRNFPYITYQVQAKDVKSVSDGVVCTVTINNSFEYARTQDCSRLEKSLAEKWSTKNVFVDETTVVKLSYRTNTMGESNTYFIIQRNEIKQASPDELQDDVLKGFEPGAILNLTQDSLSERINNESRLASF